MAHKAACHIGTSGWHYDHWKDRFYPADLPKEQWLSFYADHFETVEINNSFYHLPNPETFDLWRQTVGKGFRFAVKASRYITHMKKLKDPKESLSKFFKASEHLKNKRGPILFQLPPKWHVNTERLASFIEALPGKCRYTFEFRDESWFDKKVYDVLKEYGIAFCIYDMAGQVTPRQVTADFIYVRLHGPSSKYEGDYTKRQLNAWGKRFKDWMKDGKDIYCYFNNDLKGCAVRNADSLRQIVQS